MPRLGKSVEWQKISGCQGLRQTGRLGGAMTKRHRVSFGADESFEIDGSSCCKTLTTLLNYTR